MWEGCAGLNAPDFCEAVPGPADTWRETTVAEQLANTRHRQARMIIFHDCLVCGS